MKKRMYVFLLALLMMTVAFAGCAKGDRGSASGTAEQTGDGTGSVSEALPKKQLGGDFRVLNHDSNYAYTFMDAEADSANRVEAAVYRRNRAVEAKLDIAISETRRSYAEAQAAFNRAANAGSQDFDVYFNESWMIAPQALSGFLYDINSLNAINLNNPWWDADALEDLSIGRMQFGLLGDIHLMLNESTWVIAYNQRLALNLQLNHYYDMVRAGNWTFDALFTDIAKGAQDLDGEEGLTVGGRDVFGVVSYHGVVIPFLNSAGMSLLSRDENNMFVYQGIPETMQTVYDKIVDGLFRDFENRAAYSWLTPGLEDEKYTFQNVFISGNALFCMDCIGTLKQFADMTDDYGVLPFPKYSGDQEEYISTVARYCSMGCIPIMVEDPERSATILEYLGAYSYDMVSPEYTATLLENRYIRDTDSLDMIRLIFGNRCFDPAGTYSVGASSLEVSDGLAERVCSAASFALPSLENYVKEIRGKIDSDLEDIGLYYGALQ